MRLAVVLFALVGATWANMAPLGRAPDEITHFDLVDFVARHGSYPDFDELKLGRGALAAGLEHTVGGPRPLTPEVAVPRGDRLPLDEVRGFDRRDTFSNQMPQHPPTYYWLEAQVLTVQRSLAFTSGPLDREFALLRLTNVLMVAALPLLAWTAARRLGAGPDAALAAGVLPLAVPQLTHIGASINNDNLVTPLAGLAAVGVAGVIRGSATWRTAALVGVSAGLAMSTKANALVLVPWIGAAYALQWWRGGDRRRTAAAGGAAVAAAVVLGGWWPLRNRLRHGTFFPSIHAPEPRPEGFEPDLVDYAVDFVPRINRRFWGDFGYWDASLGSLVVGAAGLCAAILVVAAVVGRGTGSGGRPGRADTIAFGIVLVLAMGFVFQRALSLYAGQDAPPFVQGRYLFVAIIPVVVVLGEGAARLLGRWAPVAIAAAAGALQVGGMWVATGAWWAEPDASLGRKVRSMAAFSPWPEVYTYGLVALVVAMGTWLMWSLVSSAAAERVVN